MAICLSQNGTTTYISNSPSQELLVATAGAVVSPSFWHETKMADSRIGRSRDAGTTWEILNQGFPQSMKANIEAMVMEVWGESYAIFAGTTDGEIFDSDDEGDHLTKIVEGLPVISKHGHYSLLKRVAA